MSSIAPLKAPQVQRGAAVPPPRRSRGEDPGHAAKHQRRGNSGPPRVPLLPHQKSSSKADSTSGRAATAGQQAAKRVLDLPSEPPGSREESGHAHSGRRDRPRGGRRHPESSRGGLEPRSIGWRRRPSRSWAGVMRISRPTRWWRRSSKPAPASRGRSQRRSPAATKASA